MFARLPPYWLWVLLSVPALGMIPTLFGGDAKAFHQLLHPSGEFAARFLIVAMLASPLALLFKGWRGPRWLRHNRRYFGVASFAYAMLHLSIYLIDRGEVAKIVTELSKLHIWTGWVAFAIFVPLAVTSNDWAMRRLGSNWKPLQRFTYLAAALTLLHWASIKHFDEWLPAMAQFGPLILLSVYRLWYWYLRPRQSLAA